MEGGLPIRALEKGVQRQLEVKWSSRVAGGQGGYLFVARWSFRPQFAGNQLPNGLCNKGASHPVDTKFEGCTFEFEAMHTRPL